MNKKISIEIAVGIIFLIAIIIGGAVWVGNKESTEENYQPTENFDIHSPDGTGGNQLAEPKACTMEAKLCPDGQTYVSRSGPNCEFVACPENTNTESCFYDDGRISGTGCFREGVSYMEGDKCEVNFPPHFREDFNTDNANNLFSYKSIEKGIEFKMPFNKKWGNLDCKVNPYLDLEAYKVISFGKPGGPGEYRLEFLDKKSAEDTLKEIIIAIEGEYKEAYKDKYLNRGIEEENSIKLKKIGQYETVRYINFGMCTSVEVTVIGKKFNYKFISCSAKTTEETINNLENIIKTINLF
jgi:hypothetical protein